MEDTTLLIFRIRPARIKAREAAITEALRLFVDYDARAPKGGPLSEEGGLFWINVPTEHLDQATLRMSRLGYTQAVDWLRPDSSAALSEFRKVRWRGQNYRLLRIYDEDATKLRGFAPDRRTFLFETATGERRSIKGYRGDSKPLSRRALPVYDARLLVNLVCTSPGSKFLDPFAGIGGVVIEAVASGYAVTSADNDCALRFGLANLGVYFHAVADAQLLPFSDQTFDAIATEPPYDRQAASAVVNSLREMRRVLTTGGRMAMLCAAWQSEPLRRAADGIGLLPYVDTPVNRKGVDVAVLAWLKP